MTLAPDDLQRVLARGWGELHPWVPSGQVLPNVTMVFKPRSQVELGIVLDIAAASLRNASHVFSAATAGTA